MSVSPLAANNFLDSCAFDPKHEPEDAAAQEIYALYRSGALLLQIAHSTLKEVEHPNTPAWVNELAQGLIFTIDVQLEEDEGQVLGRIERTLAGNGRIENVRQDARHVFEAGKYGSYFITTDERILKRSAELRDLSGATILKPSEFLSVARSFIGQAT